MTAVLKIVGNHVSMSCPRGDGQLPLDDACRRRWIEWRNKYRRAVADSSSELLSTIGHDIYKWLDTGGWCTSWLSVAGPRQLEIAADMNPTEDQQLFLELSWEILADKNGYLADDAQQIFEVWRRIGAPQQNPEPTHKDLSLIFMAAAPQGVRPKLNFEEEEAAILSATASLDMSLVVEESGCVDILAKQALHHGVADAYHFSCHGAVLDEETARRYAATGAQRGPNLQTETEDGFLTWTTPDKLTEIWMGNPPSFVFLSACQTAEATNSIVESFVAQIARSVPAVIGWAGSVSDRDAKDFAQNFYKEAAGFKKTTIAAAIARHKLLRMAQTDNQRGRHWHLARLWLGPKGGGQLCNLNGLARRLPKNAGSNSFLDITRRRVPIAGPLTFVGRRRSAQKAIKALRGHDTAAVLLFGIGASGKSSLAARIADRLPELKPIVIFGEYDAGSIFNALCDAIPPQAREQFAAIWRNTIRDQPDKLAYAIEDLLTGPFSDKPILLIVDDLEQILEDPQPGHIEKTPLKEDYGWRRSIVALLAAFQKIKRNSRSRLLFTSRFDFIATNSRGEDLAQTLTRLSLPSFSSTERRKQWLAQWLLRQRSDDGATRIAVEKALSDIRFNDLLDNCLNISGGNPGLQDTLTRPLFAGEFDSVARALDAVRQELMGGHISPDDSAIADFFRHLALKKYQDGLSNDDELFLRAVCLFGDGEWPHRVMGIAQAALSAQRFSSVPVPGKALLAVGAAAGVHDPEKSQNRAVGLGLLDVMEGYHVGKYHLEYIINPLARPIFKSLSPQERSKLASAALPCLEEMWTDGPDAWPEDYRSVEALRLAFLSEQFP